jgi:hypothetical protein
MKGSQVARALAGVIGQKPELELVLEEQLAKWVKTNLIKGETLAGLRKIADTGGEDFMDWCLSLPSDDDLIKLTKKLDPYLPGVQTIGGARARKHLGTLIRGDAEPSRQQRPPTPDEILHMSNSDQRRIALTKLAKPALTAIIKKHEMDVGGLSKKPSKTELVEHIEAAISAGWPKIRSARDDSRY